MEGFTGQSDAGDKRTRTSWLHTHLEEFVKPHLGYIPEFSQNDCQFTSAEKAIIKNIWRQVKKEATQQKRPVYLLGRDVFIFEILARREGFPTVFEPGCSRQSRETYKFNTETGKGVPKNAYIFDTGFEGSIPRALGVESYKMMSANGVLVPTKQSFPHMTGSRTLALKIERMPKYWHSGRLTLPKRVCSWHKEHGGVFHDYCSGAWRYKLNAGPHNDFMVQPTPSVISDAERKDICDIDYGGKQILEQNLTEKGEFERATRLTIEFYKDSSPSYVKGHRPVGGERQTLYVNKTNNPLINGTSVIPGYVNKFDGTCGCASCNPPGYPKKKPSMEIVTISTPQGIGKMYKTQALDLGYIQSPSGIYVKATVSIDWTGGGMPKMPPSEIKTVSAMTKAEAAKEYLAGKLTASQYLDAVNFYGTK